MPLSAVESNWVYFLRISARTGVKIERHNQEFKIKNPVFNHTAIVRGGQSSDIFVYIQLFYHNEYQPLIGNIKSEVRQLTIIDAGANAGFFSLYCHHFFKQPRIICIEPDRHNCLQIGKQRAENQEPSWDVEQAALWTKPANVSIVKKQDGLEWNYQVEEDPSGPIQALTLAGLFAKYELKNVDILKIDVEGSEVSLFLDESFRRIVNERVRCLAIETHDAEGHTLIAGFLRDHFNVSSKEPLIFAYPK
jgi:FkbM family methyltransferase